MLDLTVEVMVGCVHTQLLDSDCVTTLRLSHVVFTHEEGVIRIGFLVGKAEILSRLLTPL